MEQLEASTKASWGVSWCLLRMLTGVHSQQFRFSLLCLPCSWFFSATDALLDVFGCALGMAFERFFKRPKVLISPLCRWSHHSLDMTVDCNPWSALPRDLFDETINTSSPQYYNTRCTICHFVASYFWCASCLSCTCLPPSSPTGLAEAHENCGPSMSAERSVYHMHV